MKTFILLLCLASPCVAQQARSVTVHLHNGDSFAGDFKRANKDVVEVDVGGTPRLVRLDDIKALEFQTPPAPTSHTPTESDLAAFQAIKALNRLSGATEVGLTFIQYGPLVVETKTAVDESLAYITDPDIRREIQSAMQDYAIAGQAWSESLQHRDGIPAKSELAAMLNERYRLGITKPKSSQSLDRAALLKIIWASADKHTEKAAKALRDIVLPQS